MRLTNGKMKVSGMVGAAAVLAMAGTAFACTQTWATIKIEGLTVAGKQLSAGSATYVGNTGDYDVGTDAGHCGGNPPRLQMTSYTPGALAFSLSVAPGTCPNTPTRQLDPGPWQVRWVAAEDGPLDNTWPYPMCHFLPSGNTSGGQWVPIGILNVDSSGNGAGTFELTGAMAGPGNICLDNGTNTAPPVIPIKWAVI